MKNFMRNLAMCMAICIAVCDVPVYAVGGQSEMPTEEQVSHNMQIGTGDGTDVSENDTVSENVCVSANEEGIFEDVIADEEIVDTTDERKFGGYK